MIIYNNFEWDVREAAASLARQGVSFKEASTVFSDPEVALSDDSAPGQLRATGRSARGRVLVVLHRPGPRTRILAAALPGKPLLVGAASEAPEAEPAAAAAPETRTATPPPRPEAPSPAPSAPARSRKPAAAPATPKPAPAPAPVAAEPPEAENDGAAASSKPSGAGWTAEAYGIYWDAYTAAREEARRQGKSPREAQRIGREAGERAAFGASAPAASEKPASEPPASGASPRPGGKASPRSGTWRAAARALKVS
jgi:uncharacterized DUF497 family protein